MSSSSSNQSITSSYSSPSSAGSDITTTQYRPPSPPNYRLKNCWRAIEKPFMAVKDYIRFPCVSKPANMLDATRVVSSNSRLVRARHEEAIWSAELNYRALLESELEPLEEQPEYISEAESHAFLMEVPEEYSAEMEAGAAKRGWKRRRKEEKQILR